MWSVSRLMVVADNYNDNYNNSINHKNFALKNTYWLPFACLMQKYVLTFE